MAGIPQPGPAYFGPPPAPAPGTIQQRNSVVVLLLSIVTCWFYFLYWVYQTSSELKQATGDPDINPVLDLVLSFVTCSLWGYYVLYRDAQKLHRMLVGVDPGHQDQSQTVLILCVASLFVGVTAPVALYLVQEDFNRLARGGR
jgi:hypothetical protein